MRNWNHDLERKMADHFLELSESDMKNKFGDQMIKQVLLNSVLSKYQGSRFFYFTLFSKKIQESHLVINYN